MIIATQLYSSTRTQTKNQEESGESEDQQHLK